MSPEASQEYQHAVEEAANAFMRVMSLRGFQVRDYPQNFVAELVKSTRLSFETARGGAHLRANLLVAEILNAGSKGALTAPVPVKNQSLSVNPLHRRLV